GIHLGAIQRSAHTIAQVAHSTPLGFGNLRFAVLGNCGPGSPFFPASFHGAESTTFAVATESADLAVDSLTQASTLDEARANLRTATLTTSAPEPVASVPYVAITLAMLSRAGIEYDWDQPNRIRVPAPQVYPRLDTIVEGDCSSASYFWGAAALTGGDVFTHPVSKESLQGDCRFLEVLSEMGCEVRWERDGVRVQGPGALRSLNRDMNAMPDMVPTLAVLAAFAEGGSRIRNVAHLRVKESDRLSVVASELRKFSVPVEELPDGLVIQGGRVMPPTRPIEAHDDHRIAMAFAMAGLRTSGVEIWGAEAVSKSFPSFWELFETLYSQQEAS
ncbi:MAG: DUF711 family protein, partial [Syntrophobacteraceae bacterium]|nr:DUF711 family protein [Syntrophobacteraceae bacterium]